MKKSYNSIIGIIILISIVLIYIYFNKKEDFQIQDFILNNVDNFKNNLKQRIQRIQLTQEFTNDQYNILEQINTNSHVELYNKIEKLSTENLKQLLHDAKLFMDMYEKYKNNVIDINKFVIWLNKYFEMNNW